MSVPDLSNVVRMVRATFPDRFADKAQLCAYAHAVVVALHQIDANFGHLRKVEAQNHCTDPVGRFVAVDVALFRPTRQIVDFIASAGFGPDASNAPTWGVGPEGEYTEADWIEPVDDGAEPGPVDPPDLPLEEGYEVRIQMLESRVALLEHTVQTLDTLRIEMAGQIGSHNEFLAKLDRRRYAGRASVFGYSVPVTCDTAVDK